MVSVMAHHMSDGVAFLAVSDIEDVSAVTQAAVRMNLPAVALADAEADQLFAVTRYPVTFFLKADGTIVDRIERGTTGPAFEQRLVAALARAR